MTPAEAIHLYRTDPHFHAMWDGALLYVRSHIDRGAELDGPRVIELRDTFHGLYEAGAERSLQQAKAIDAALTDHAIHSPPSMVLVPSKDPP